MKTPEQILQGIRAREAGKLAAEQGKKLDENPFPEEAEEHWLWLDAWCVERRRDKLTAPMSAALPCPHCGAPARKNRYHGDRSRIFYGCSRDECNFTYPESEEAAALAAWNQRWPISTNAAAG